MRTATPWSSTLRFATAIALTALVGCSSESATEPQTSLTPSGQPQDLIRDAARNGGAAGFYFLSPIAPNLASYPGQFDASREPVVEICRWTGAACDGALVARYTMTGGTGNTSIQVVPADQAYRVDWPIAGVQRGVLHRIRVLEGGVERGVADAKIPASGETFAGLQAQGVVPLGNTSRLSIRFRMEVNQKPTVTITGPSNDANIPKGTAVLLAATASDPEQGDLTSQIVWRSSKVVEPLGTGGNLTVSNLPSGRQTLSASVTDAAGGTTTRSISVVVSIVSLQPTLNVALGGTASLPITLSEPAPAGGLTFTVSSTNTSRVGVSSSTVTIPAGQQSVNATVQGAGPGVAAVTVSNADFGSATTQVGVAAQLDIVEGSVSFPQGRDAQITIRLRSGGADAAAPSGGLSVTLTPANAACAAVTSPVTIPAGLVSTTATVTYGGTAATPCNTTITASATGIPEVSTDNLSVSVAQSPAIFLGGNGSRVGAGLRGGNFGISLGAPAPAGGLEVTLTSSNGAVVRVAAAPQSACGATTPSALSTTVTIPAGEQSACFWADGLEGQSGTVTVTAAAPGYTNGTASLTVAAPMLAIQNVPSSTTSLSPNTPFYALIGVPNAANTGAAAFQPVRPGGTPVTVTATSSNAGVAQVGVQGGASGASVTLTLGPGQQNTPTSGAGSFQLDPLSAGTTTISLSAPGTVVTPQASQAVTVTAPAANRRPVAARTN